MVLKGASKSRVQKQGPKAGSKNEVQKQAPREGSKSRVQKAGRILKQGPKSSVQKQGPKAASKSKVQKQSPKAGPKIGSKTESNDCTHGIGRLPELHEVEASQLHGFLHAEQVQPLHMRRRITIFLLAKKC